MNTKCDFCGENNYKYDTCAKCVNKDFMDLIDRIIENSKPYNIDISFGEYLESEKLNYQTELNELEELPTEQGNTPLIGYIIGGIIGFLVYLVLWICLYFLGVIK